MMKKIKSLVKDRKGKINVNTTQTQRGKFSGGTKCNYIIWKFQNNLSPPNSQHFKYKNSPITWDRAGNRNKVIK